MHRSNSCRAQRWKTTAAHDGFIRLMRPRVEGLLVRGAAMRAHILPLPEQLSWPDDLYVHWLSPDLLLLDLRIPLTHSSGRVKLLGSS
jgi:hypothetical protein